MHLTPWISPDTPTPADLFNNKVEDNHAIDSTGGSTVLNHHVPSLTYVTNVDRVIQVPDATPPPTHHSFLNFSNNLPTSTPLSDIDIYKLHELTVNHPDRQLVQYILHGLTEGFNIGFTISKHFKTKKFVICCESQTESK